MHPRWVRQMAVQTIVNWMVDQVVGAIGAEHTI
jgi:hypothetical protein